MQKLLQKYHQSTFKGEKITQLNINSFDTFTVITQNHKKTFFSVNYHNNDNRELSADYLICEIQENIDIQVRKY
tara:strand:- start:483 stop:704 length:222 start_codon:yes stop_codon:yes gene_type:complete